MRFKIIDASNDDDFIIFVANYFFDYLENYSKNHKTISGFIYYNEDLVDLYECIFNIKNNKIFKTKTKNKIISLYQNFNIFNMYDFLKINEEYVNDISTNILLEKCINKEINFIKFDRNKNKISNELIIDPSLFDKKIKKISNNKIAFIFCYINEKFHFPFLENYIENIGTNITTLSNDLIYEINKKKNKNLSIEQSINCGNKIINNAEKLFILIKRAELQKIINNKNKNTLAMQIVKNHKNVIFIVKE